MSKLLVALVVVSVLCTGCVLTPRAAAPQATLAPTPEPTPAGCTGADLDAFRSAVEDASTRFDDAVTLGISTSRIALSPIVADMQAARREVAAAYVPPCTEEAKAALEAYMDQVIDTFILFMGEGSDAQVEASFDVAADLLDSYGAEVRRIAQEASEHDA